MYIAGNISLKKVIYSGSKNMQLKLITIHKISILASIKTASMLPAFKSFYINCPANLFSLGWAPDIRRRQPIPIICDNHILMRLS